MLKSILIKNYILIDHLDIILHDGFSVITGETGAGKSIILGAMNFLMGGRIDGRILRNEQEKCTIEGHFDITGYGLEKFFSDNELDLDASDTIIRRELLPSGKSRAFINDTPVTIGLLKDLCGNLIDIHSQHQNLALGTQAFQIDVVDRIAGNRKISEEYISAYREYHSIFESLTKLKVESVAKSTDTEYIKFQLDGLDRAHLTDGEQEELEQESDLLQHSEEIKGDLFQANNIFSGEEVNVIQSIKQALQALRSASNKMRSITDLSERLNSCLIELKDIDSEVSQAEESVSYNPERLEQVSERLDLIYSLQKKHNVQSVSELIKLKEEFEQKLLRIDSYDSQIEELTAQCHLAEQKMKESAKQLTTTRKKAATSIEKSISALLIPLGIPNVQFKISIEPKTEYSILGNDNLKFLFSANKSVPLQELAVIASGGEIARVMLSVKSLIAGSGSLPTIIFDEIDTGVSGAIAEKMALMMRQMSADGRQVIAITHLPQIAAVGDYHYKVYKQDSNDSTHTKISLLEKEERILELAGMMSGSTLTDAAINNAKSLIENNGR